MKKYVFPLMALLLVSIAIKAAIARPVAASPVDPVSSPAEIDGELRINYPLIGSKVRGKTVIKGKAKRNSFVEITVSSTYFELGKDMQKEKVFKGKGPLKGTTRKVKVKTSGQGFWSTDAFTFHNRGWSEEFKIVARSVEGKNAVYVIVKDENRPIVQWD